MSLYRLVRITYRVVSSVGVLQMYSAQTEVWMTGVVLEPELVLTAPWDVGLLRTRIVISAGWPAREQKGVMQGPGGRVGNVDFQSAAHS